VTHSSINQNLSTPEYVVILTTEQRQTVQELLSEAAIKLGVSSISLLRCQSASDKAIIIDNEDLNDDLLNAAMSLISSPDKRHKLITGIPVISHHPTIIAVAPISYRGNLWGILVCDDGTSNVWDAEKLSVFIEIAVKITASIAHELDITRISAEKEFFESISNKIADAFLSIDTEGKILKATGASLSNLFSEPIVGRNVKTLLHTDASSFLEWIFRFPDTPEVIEIKCDVGNRKYLTYSVPSLNVPQVATLVLICISTYAQERSDGFPHMHQIVDVVWQTDLNLEYTYISPSLKHYLDQSDEIARIFNEELVPSNLPGLPGYLEEIKNMALKPGEITPIPSREIIEFKLRDSSPLFIEAIYEPRVNEQHSLIGITGQYRDITSWFTKEANSLASCDRISFILNHIKDVVACHDQKGLITYVSPSITQYGYNPEELIGRNAAEVFCGDYQQVLKDNLKELQKGISGIHEYPIRLKNGVNLWARMHSQPVFDKRGRYIETITVISDITKYKDLEKKIARIAQLQPYLEHLIGKTKNLLWISDMHLNTIFISPSIEAILGYTVEEAMRMELGVLFKKGSLKIYEETIIQAYKSAIRGKNDWCADLTVYQATVKNRIIKGSLHLSLFVGEVKFPCGIMCEISYSKNLQNRKFKSS